MQHGRLIPLHLRLLLTEPLSGAQLEGLGWPGREGVIDSRRVFNYFRLTDDDRILFGGGRPRYLWGGRLADRPAEGPDLDQLVGAFRRRFPSLANLPIARSWTGVIAYTLDTLPVIAPAPGHERVLFVGGWCGHGIALEHLLGTLGSGVDRRGEAARGPALVPSETAPGAHGGGPLAGGPDGRLGHGADGPAVM